ncbi:cell division protein DedD [Photobacterium jeanii]|uniref:Cell division protein DedD n=1 Tax=Photobacterium jeanii TaxID=858640 RepID=A0A178KA95_9GAMM|nr:SPOR domain-containing protein [Photobacterium jeanii]OAN13563.1 cell division protein DedD [Photobacterium jeanii]PST88677.1 cell division protein DedD [Photobacterium jeanii]
MASKFQSRLVGTIILVALGVIFLPDLFDGKKQHYQEQFASIPLQPEINAEEAFETIPEPEFVDVELPQEPVTVVIDEEPQIEDAPLPVEPTKVEPPKQGYKESGWVVQLGVFGNVNNANKLVAKLRKAGYQAHVFPKELKPGDYARVVVGPNVSKEELSGQLKDLEKITGLKGQLLRFNPLNP